MDNNFYKETFEQIQITDEMERKLLDIPKAEEKVRYEQNRLREIRALKYVAVALLAFLLIGMPVAATVLYSHSSYPLENSLTNQYTAVGEMGRKMGLSFHCPQVIGHDYRFHNMNVNKNEVTDGDHHQIYTFFSMHISYDNGENMLTYDIVPRVEGYLVEEEKTWLKLMDDNEVFTGAGKNDKDIRYVFTKGIASYEDVEELEYSQIVWSDEKNDYCLSGYGVGLTAEEFYMLASDIENRE